MPQKNKLSGAFAIYKQCLFEHGISSRLEQLSNLLSSPDGYFRSIPKIKPRWNQPIEKSMSQRFDFCQVKKQLHLGLRRIQVAA